MKILVFDTSSESLAAGIFENQRLISESVSEHFVRHSESLSPVLKKLCQKARVPIQKINCIVVGLGPGSFTGLRVGVVTAKTLAYALGAKLIGVSTFEAMAQTSLEEGEIPIAVDARRGNVYCAIYKKRNNVLKTLQKPAILPQEKFFLKIGREVHTKEKPMPQGLLAAAWPLIEKQKFTDPFRLEPLYLYPKDCNAQKQ